MTKKKKACLEYKSGKKSNRMQNDREELKKIFTLTIKTIS